MRKPSHDDMLLREQVANESKHWVRAVTACNSRCLFCLDSDTPRGVILPTEEVQAELRRGRDELGATRVVISGGEASLHPSFMELIAYAKEIGYRRVQTVTNGYRFGEPGFLQAALDAGLGEITYSLHGHDAELHDRLTGTPGAFRRITRAMLASVRDGRPIVNVDVCINKQNVAALDKIIELSIALGVREFDLLHVIPQAAAYDNRDELFYDPRDHLDVLQRVFRLARHPRVTVWTNRFPVAMLEGLEDLIQDPHKMLDEINGRRFQVQRYLDHGEPLDCRDPERCQHCFIAPMCTSVDETIAKQRESAFEVWDLGDGSIDGGELPFGTTRIALDVEGLEDAKAALASHESPLWLRPRDAFALDELTPRGPLWLTARTREQLESWIGDVSPESVHRIQIELTGEIAPWLLEHADTLADHAERIWIHQPSYEHLADARAHDVRHPRGFFAALRDAVGRPLAVSGLPSCLVPGMTLIEPPATLELGLFDPDSGRARIRELARAHVRHHYRSKSLRCRDCRVDARCPGAHIHLLRDQGLGILRPWTEGPAADAAEARARALHPEPLRDVAAGSPPVGPSPSLPGFAQPTEPVVDPLGLIAEQRLLRRRRRAAEPT